jgi:PKD repeat protein
MNAKKWMAWTLTLVLLLGLVHPAWAAPAAAQIEDSLASSPQRLSRGEAPAGLSSEQWASMQAQMRLAEYQFTWQVQDGEWAYRAPNRAMGLSLSFEQGGLKARASDWQFGLHLAAYGAQSLPAVIPQDGLSAKKAQVTYRWDTNVSDEYANTPKGVKQTVTLSTPPASGELTLEYALNGDLMPKLDGSGGLTLNRADGAAVLGYDGFTAHDATGRQLSVRLALTAGGLRITLDAAGAVYPLTVEAVLQSEVAILHASDAQYGDAFGYSVAVSGDVAVVGAVAEDGGTGDPLWEAGAAYIFQRSEGRADEWGEVNILRASDAQADDYFGASVAVSGDVIVVAAPYEDGGAGNPFTNAGAAYVFQRTQGGADGWEEVNILRASDAQEQDYFGYSVAVSGDVVVIGAYYEDGGAGDPLPWAGAAYVFQRTQGGADAWEEVRILHAPDAQAYDWFGHSVAVSGDVIVVGAPYEDGGSGDPLTWAGAAYVFQRTQGGADAWGDVNILRASDTQEGDEFGFAVAVSGDVIIVGAPIENGGAGASYVFQRTQGGADSWGEVKILHASDAQAADWFGCSVAVSGDVIVAGAPYEDGGVGDPLIDAGTAYVFQRTQDGADGWGEVQTLHASDAQANDWFGYSVAASGDGIIVGAYVENGGAGDPLWGAGAAYVFQSESHAWQETTIARASDAQAGDFLGYSVAVSGDVIIVGAIGEDGGAGDPLTDAGAAYVFQRSQGGADAWGEVNILRASDAQENDYFGGSVSVSGDVIVVGASNKDGGVGESLPWSGVAYVFQRSQGGVDNWGEVQILHASDAQVEDHFGYSVAVSGDVIVVGASDEDGGEGDPLPASGAAYVFQRNLGGADNWGEVKILHASDAQWDDQFGYSLALSGDVIVVGAPYENGGAGDAISDAGAAYVFQRSLGGADNWGEVKIMHASDAQEGDHFGYSVAISGDSILVGAPEEDGGEGNPLYWSGAAYVFQRTQGGVDAWGEVTILLASDAQEYDHFGSNLAVSGDVVVIGATGEDGGPGDPLPCAGAAYVFQRTQGGADAWGELQILHASDAKEWDGFGRKVAISGDVIIVGVIYEDGGAGNPLPDAGAAYIFQTGGYVNHAPELDPIGDQSGDEQTSITFTANASDSDPDDTLVFSLDPGAPDGASMDPSSGIFTWTPSEAQGPGVYTITVRVTDDGVPPLDDFETLTITVIEVNQAPVLAAIGDQSGDEGTLISFTASATDADLPPNTLVFSLDPGAPDGAGIDPSSGEFTWTPTEVQGPGIYTVTVRVTDDGIPPLDDCETITITVSEVNQPPQAVDDEYATDEDTPLVVAAPGLLTNDSDADLPANPLSTVLDSPPAEGDLLLNADGSFVYTPTLNFNGLITFTYHAFDGQAASNLVTVSIEINPVNDAPIAEAGEDQTTSEGQAVKFNGSYTDPDLLRSLGIGQQHTISWDFGDGATASGVLTPTHTYADNGVYTVTLAISDGLGGVGMDWLVVTVVNVAPELAALPNLTITVGEPLTLTGAFSDPGLLDAHTVLINWGDGLTETQELLAGVYDFSAGYTYAIEGVYTVTVTVTDDDGGSDSQSFTVTVEQAWYSTFLPFLTKE